MSPSDVCNRALSGLGQAPISGLDEGSINANRCQFIYSDTVDFVLRSHRWQCAKFFAELSEVSPAPIYKWAHAFDLPNGDDQPYCLRVYEVNENPEAEWQISGRTIVTQETTAKIEYTGRLTDPTVWDAMLRKVIVMILQSELCMPLRHDPKEAQGLYGLAMSIMADAMGINSQEQSMETFSTTDLLDVRGG